MAIVNLKSFLLTFFCLGIEYLYAQSERTVVLTFDDAPESHYSFVAPLLKEYNFRGTFYVCEFPGVYPDTTKQMNWRMIKAIEKMGMEIGNHTKDHTKLRASNYQKQLLYIENKCDSMDIRKPTSYAYPVYSVDSTSLPVLKENGYTTARIGGDRAYDPKKDSNPLLIPSYTITKDNKQLFYNALQDQKEGEIVVYCFHGVPDIAHPWVSVEQETFREYMNYLKKNDYKVISMRDLKMEVGKK